MHTTLKQLEINGTKEHWYRNGFYLIDGHICEVQKTKALHIATRRGTRDVKYMLCDEDFDKQDWTKEPEIDLDTLYRLRCEQLRDQYDYVVLSYSAGSDSHNVLHSFVSNNIKLDEVLRYGYFAKGFTETNTYSNYEYHMASKDLLKNFVLDQGIKYRQQDLSVYVDRYLKDENYVLESPHTPVANRVLAQGIVYIEEYQRMLEQGKKVCVIQGIEKPQVIYRDGQFKTYYNDINQQENFSDRHFIGDVAKADMVRFYTTPELPELQIKQCHVLKNFFKASLDSKGIEKKLVLGRDFDFREYKSLCNRLLYANSWNGDKIFSLGKIHKPTHSYFRDDWIHQHRENQHIAKILESGWQLINREIDGYWFNDPKIKIHSDFVGVISRFYNLGN